MGKQIVSTMMKKINYLLVGLLGSALLFSCGESMKKMKEAKEGYEAMGELAKAGSSFAKDTKNLSEVDAWSQQDFEKWAPGTSFRGLERTEMTLGNHSEASIHIVYGSANHGKRLDIVVVDGADPVGTMLISLTNMFLNSDLAKKKINEDPNDGNIVDKHGVTAKEYYSGGENTIETVVNERFYVKLAGYDMTIDEVWDVFKALKTDKLK